MVIEHRNFDEKIRGAFGDFEVMPPAHVWYGISLGMASPAPRRVAPLLLKLAAGLTIFILSALSFWFLTFQPSGDVSQLAAASSVSGSVEASELVFNEVGPATLRDESLTNVSLINSSRADIIDIPTTIPFNAPASLLAFLSGTKPALLPPTLDFQQKILPLEESPSFLAFASKGVDFSFLTLGVHMAPQYSFRHLARPSEIDNGGIPFENLESALFSFNIGFSASAKVLPWLSIQTGLNYSTMGQFVSDIIAFSHPSNLPLFEIDPKSHFGHPQTIVTSQGNIRLSEPSLFFADAESYRVITNKQYFVDGDPKNLTMRDFGISQYFTFLEVPLIAQAKLLEMQHANIHIKAGGSMNYLLSNEVFLGRKTMQKPIGETYGLRKFNFSVIGGVALNVPLNNRLSLTFEPSAQYFLMPMVRDQLMIGRALPFQYSVFTGITYGF
jgi:hypothetical protein